MAQNRSRPFVTELIRPNENIGRISNTIENAKENCNNRSHFSSLGCYFCVIGRMVSGKPIRRIQDDKISDRIVAIGIIGFPFAIFFIVFIALVLIAQSREIARLEAMLQIKSLLSMSLAQLSEVTIDKI